MAGRSVSRRDFLKLCSLVPPALYTHPNNPRAGSDGDALNILILIFDSWTHANSSLYGYLRETTPNITRRAEKAIVYHNHYASGHYTYPSTASLLTGVLPWTHKGYWPGPEMILPDFETRNIFSLFEGYYRSAYTNNSLAEAILRRMNMKLNLEFFEPREYLALQQPKFWEALFNADRDIYDVSWVRGMDLREDGFANSLFLSRLTQLLRNRSQKSYEQLYPRGLPVMVGEKNFLVESTTDWLTAQIPGQPTPYLSYYHLLPPHEPYTTRTDFVDLFLGDGYEPVHKPRHPLSENDYGWEYEKDLRRQYDEYLAFVDFEFERLMVDLEQSGALENTIVVLTSDHGEMFERGIYFHMVPSFHRPLTQIPLLIFMPGRTERVDIHSLTSTIDVMPTLLQLAGKAIPDWVEGEVLPPFNPDPDPGRLVFGVDLRHNPKEVPFVNGTGMVRYGDYKLTHIFGSEAKYKPLSGEMHEFYNLAEDPEELNNLHNKQPDIEDELIVILDKGIRAAESSS